MPFAIGSTPLFALRATVLDTETTGLNTDTARVIQIGCVRMQGREILSDDLYCSDVNPHEKLTTAGIAIHGITDKQLVDAPDFADVVDDMLEFLGDTLVIGHNIGFDLSILKAEFHRSGLPWQPPRALDTAFLARAVRPMLPDHSLDTVAHWLGVEITDRHTALGDARATAEVFLKLLPLLAEQNIRTVGAAERICRNTGRGEGKDVPDDWESSNHGPRRSRPAATYRHVDSFAYRHRVKEIMSAPPVFVAGSATLSSVSLLLSDRSVSSVFVGTGAAGDMTGIVTERDLMRVLARADGSQDVTAGDIMSTPLITIDSELFVYQAIGQMHRRRVRHLGVHDSTGAIVGIITSGDLMRERANDALILGVELDQADSADELAEVWSRIPLVARSMQREGHEARTIAAIIAEEICALTRRSAQLGERMLADEGYGPPPQPYNVLVLGSGGRGETLLCPDQDNAIIYQDAGTDDKVDAWFARLGNRFADILNQAGLDYCNGGVMAKNQDWRHDLVTWKSQIRDWVTGAETSDLWHIDIFYDFRSVLGDDAAPSEIRTYAYDIARDSRGLLRNLAVMATDFRAPISLFGNIKTDDGRVDLKKHGLLAIVSGARVLALRHGIVERATKTRLEALHGLPDVNSDDLRNIVDAHDILLSEILRQQLDDIETGLPLTNKVEIRGLSSHEKSQLKWALEQVDVIKSMVGDPVVFG